VISVRWRKVARESGALQVGTLLAVMAIAIGIFGAGSVLAGYAILTHEIDANFPCTNPASSYLYTDNADEKLAEHVKNKNGVADAQARVLFMARIQVGQDDWVALHYL